MSNYCTPAELSFFMAMSMALLMASTKFIFFASPAEETKTDSEGREGEIEGREGGRDRGKKGGRERSREGGREGSREGVREGARDRGREEGKNGWRRELHNSHPSIQSTCTMPTVCYENKIGFQ